MFLNLQLPNAASLQRTEASRSRRSRRSAGEDARRRIRPPASSASACSALSGPATTHSSSSRLKDWERPQKPETSSIQVIKAARERRNLRKLPEGMAFGFSPPAIPGVGTSGGFTFVLEDRSGSDVAVPRRQPEQVHGRRAQAAGDRQPDAPPSCRACRSSSSTSTATRCSSRASPSTMSTGRFRRSWAGSFVNYFNRFGRQWQVYVEAEGDYRDRAGERRPVLRAEPNRRDGAALRADEIRVALRP